MWVTEPTVGATTDFTTSFTGELDEAGTIFYVVWPAAAAAASQPTAREVRAGDGPTGAGSAVVAGSAAVPGATVMVVVNITTSLQAETDYVLFVAAEDDEGALGNLQAVTIQRPFSTLPGKETTTTTTSNAPNSLFAPNPQTPHRRSSSVAPPP